MGVAKRRPWPTFGFVAALVVMTAAACGEDPPSVEIAGGGFIFNYRLAEAHYGIVASVGGDVPDGASLEAAFEDPAGGPQIPVRAEVTAGQRRYKFETPPLTGIEAERPYTVTLRLLDPDGAVLAEATKAIHSKLGQDVLPPRPLTVGPGYHRPPPADRPGDRTGD